MHDDGRDPSRQQRRAFDRELSRLVERAERTGDLAAIAALGRKCNDRGHIELELRCHQAILELDATNLDTRINVAACLDHLGRTDEATLQVRQALRMHPRDARLLQGLSELLRKQDRVAEAIEFGRRAVALAPDSAGAHIALSAALLEGAAFDDAVSCAERAVNLAPKQVDSYVNAGLVYAAAGKPELALAFHERARSQGLTSLKLDWNESLILIGLGRLSEAWEFYDRGFDVGARQPNRSFPIPMWNGEDLTSKSILVWREQGLGDEVRFLGCVPDLVRSAAQVTVEVSPRLASIVQRSFPASKVVHEGQSPSFSEFDFHCPMGSLPRWFRRKREDFPRHQGYFAPSPTHLQRFRSRIEASADGKMVVGVSWRSGRLDTRRLIHYLTLDELTPLFKVDDVCFVNLQYGDALLLERELSDLEAKTGVHVHRWVDVDYTNDLEAVAALTSLTDIVVGPGSFPTDLASALGVRALILGTGGDFQAIQQWWFPQSEVFQRAADQRWDVPVRLVAEAVRAAGQAARADEQRR